MTLALVRELAACGVRHCVLSPGSRSAPLALAALRCEPLGLRLHPQLDERSAAFFALGIAKASGRPALLICTSGTAAANYLPAVVEAHYAGTPLIVLTADRPPELRDCDAGQTIDQVRLYGSHVRWFHELPLPEPGAAAERLARAVALRALACACGASAGPVHLNWPLREPLTPPREVAPVEPICERQSAHPVRLLAPGADEIDALAALARREERGVIVAGPLPVQSELAVPVARFAEAAGWPVLADAASQLRFGPHAERAALSAAYELTLRDGAFARAHAPRAVLRLGSAPTSKALRLWLEASAPADGWLLDPAARFSDASRLATARSASDPSALLDAAAAALGGGTERTSAWRNDFARAERAAQRALSRALDAEPALREPRLARELVAALPDGALLALSNSMPVRDVDAFAPASPQRLRVLVNRGANGIDGVTSTALGASAAWPGPVVLLTGDLAFLHDLGGLAAVRHAGSLTIVLVENGGGGIFSFLPIAEHGEAVAFERLFRTPHGLELRKSAELFGIGWERVSSWPHFRAALKGSLATGGVSVIEVPVDPDANVRAFRALARIAADAAAEACA
jgi:2-succinyl-5-enolpyruvyl-6-hydroxy-3-cyclohexene-1-carboxylate synthase